ncbi:hypothetical protein [Pedobacter sp. GR22-6]|uniref:hypothetical protein n=1 Tax=Pedobacter sp. GR22-6 TaxID=3127957 RepID=UPI00307D5088
MNKIYLSLIGGTLCLLISSCKTYLSPAVLGNNIGYLARPMLSDDKHSATYVNGAYAAALSPSGLSIEMGMLTAHRSHTFNSFNLSYGAFGFLGKAMQGNSAVELNEDELPPFKKSTYGLGLRTSMGYQLVSGNGNTNFRLINWENSYSVEAGDYLNYRKSLFNKGLYSDISVSDQKNVWTTGLSTEIIWHARRNKNIQHAFRYFIGFTPGALNSFDNGNSAFKNEYGNTPSSKSFSYFLKIYRVSLTYEYSSNINLGNSISLGYSF